MEYERTQFSDNGEKFWGHKGIFGWQYPSSPSTRIWIYNEPFVATFTHNIIEWIPLAT